jgi:hypothetical protein
MPIVIPLATFFEIASTVASIGAFFATPLGMCAVGVSFAEYNPADVEPKQ